jgi:hypothetical protein
LQVILPVQQWQTILEIFDKQVVHGVAAPIIQAIMMQLQGQQPQAHAQASLADAQTPPPHLKEVT